MLSHVCLSRLYQVLFDFLNLKNKNFAVSLHGNGEHEIWGQKDLILSPGCVFD